MATVQEFFRNPLVTWVTSFRTSSAAENINDFADGVFLNEVMVEIDPTYFTLTRVHQNVDGDVNVRIQNLDFLVRHLKEFYQEKLQQLVLMRAPDVVAIAHCPDSDVGLQELVKLLLLMLGCAVQCDNKELFIEKIKDMDLEVQKHLVEYIKQITDNANHVLTFRMNELQDSTIEHVLVVAESMFYQMGHIISERDQSFTDNTHLRLEKELLLQERQRAKSPRPFSPPPATGHLNVDSPSMAASKEKLRMLTEEMEEKNSMMAELKDELLASKKMIEKLRQENKDLSQDAVLVKAFRDQIDVLKVKADRVEKLETDAVKFKEKLRDLEYLKKRAEELKEENVILLDNRQLLREQLSSLSNKEERIEILEEENKKLKNHIHHIAEERQFEQEKLNEVMATNARLNIEKQESMAELASLTAEIEVLRGKSPSGSVNLASECQESSSIDVLRLSHQNEHLKKSLEDLRSSSTKLIELERENRAVHQKFLEEKSTVHKLKEELAKAKTLNKQKTEEAEKFSKALHALQNDLHSSSNEVLNLSGELKLKDEAIANLENENYSHVSELQEKLKDAEGKELSMTSLKERVVKNEMQLVALDNKNRDKDLAISDKQRTIEELSDSLHDKDREIKGLQSRLNESVEDQSKADTIIRKQKKEIADLENRSLSIQQEGADKSPFPGQDISDSSNRIPLNAEPDFRELKKEKTKYYKHECHQQNLKQYRERGMIPEGLRLNATPYVSDMTEKFKAKWEVILRSASEMLLDLLIAHHEQALQTTWRNITCMEKNIMEKYGEDLALKILQLGNEIAKKDKEKLQEKAQHKLVKRSNKPHNKHESFDNNSLQREDSPHEAFRSRDKFGGSGRRQRPSRSNSQRSYVGMGRGRKSQV